MNAAVPSGVPALPVACTLDGQEGPVRMLRWQRLVESAHAVAARRGRELEVRFDAGPMVAAELSSLAAAERGCCAFLDWSVETGAKDNVLLITADAASPDDIETVAHLFGVV